MKNRRLKGPHSRHEKPDPCAACVPQICARDYDAYEGCEKLYESALAAGVPTNGEMGENPGSQEDADAATTEVDYDSEDVEAMSYLTPHPRGMMTDLTHSRV